MANDQYQIPELYNEHEIRAQIEAIQLQPTPEYEKQGKFQHIKDIEADIYALRERALTRQAKSKNWLKSIVITPQAPTLHELIEAESKLGGKIFGNNVRFWLDEKQPTGYHNEGDEWFFEQPNTHTNKDTTVLRFQTTSDEIYKLYDGAEYPMTQDDTESFTKAAELYKSAIAPLYFE